MKHTKIKHNPYGPAVIGENGYKEYWINGKRHRLDGPAVIGESGYKEYFVNNKFMGFSKECFYTKIKKLKTNTINNQDKLNILNIKNLLSNNLDPSSLNILKSLL